MLRVDSHFEIGSMHQICEDFTVHGEEENTQLGKVVWGIVSDGCSGSPDTDTGARILVHCANRALRAMLNNHPPAILGCAYLPLPETLVGMMQLRLGQNHSEQALVDSVYNLGLSSRALDATLWIVIGIAHNDGTVSYRVVGWGDGVVVTKVGDNITMHHFEFPSGAPYYLNYTFNDDRAMQYVVQCGTEFFQTDITTDANGNGVMIKKPIPYNEPVVLDFPNMRPDLIAVFTDGVKTYTVDETEEEFGSMRWGTKRLIDFKSFEGVFFQRRMKALARRDAKNSIKHYDDIGGACIVEVGEE